MHDGSVCRITQLDLLNKVEDCGSPPIVPQGTNLGGWHLNQPNSPDKAGDINQSQPTDLQPRLAPESAFQAQDEHNIFTQPGAYSDSSQVQNVMDESTRRKLEDLKMRLTPYHQITPQQEVRPLQERMPTPYKEDEPIHLVQKPIALRPHPAETQNTLPVNAPPVEQQPQDPRPSQLPIVEAPVVSPNPSTMTTDQTLSPNSDLRQNSKNGPVY
jgi:hypothetical protein